jgi:predicted dehydrogenase
MNDPVAGRSFASAVTLAAALIASNLFAAGPPAASPQSAPAASTAPFRIAVVGLVHPHAADVLRMLHRSDLQVVGVSEPLKEVRADFVSKGLPPTLLFQDEAMMIEKTHPQAVVIYTTTYDHRRAVEIAAHYGVDAMMEKPLAVSVADAQAMASAARKGNIQLLVNFVTTWYPSNTTAYTLLHDGSIGVARKIIVKDGHNSPRPLSGPYGWIVDPKLNGGGALFDFGCYGANLSTWLMDGQRPTSVTAVTQTIKSEIYTQVDDETTIILTYPKAQAILQPSWNWPFDRKDMEVYGQSGYAITVGANELLVRKAGGTEEQISLSPLRPPQDDPLTYLKAVVVDGMKPSGPSSLDINIVATEILEAARESARTGKRIDLSHRPAAKSEGK